MTAPNFSHLRGLALDSSAVAFFTFSGLEGEPKLQVRPATEANKAYLSAHLEAGRKLSRRLRGGKITAELLGESREINRGLFAKHVVIGWDPATVLDSSNIQVPFSPEACQEFLQAIPSDMFDELVNFCSQPNNFRSTDSGTEEDLATVAGN